MDPITRPISPPPSSRVGFIGLGTMGRAMAHRLLDAGVELTVWNRSRGPADELAARGAEIATDAAEAFLQPVVISMLADDEAVCTLMSDELLSAVGPGRTHVNMATISVEAARLLQQRHTDHGVAYLSAPVLGRAPVAAKGNLLILAAGHHEALDVARPLLSILGQRTWELGTDATTAAAAKIGVNYNLIHALQAIGESVALVERHGVDPSQFIELLTHTMFAGSAYTGYGALIAERRYDNPGFAMNLGLKDLGLAASAAASVDLDLPSLQVLTHAFEVAVADPALMGLDWSAMAEVTRRA